MGEGGAAEGEGKEVGGLPRVREIRGRAAEGEGNKGEGCRG